MESLAFRNRFLLKQRMHKAPQAQGTLTLSSLEGHSVEQLVPEQHRHPRSFRLAKRRTGGRQEAPVTLVVWWKGEMGSETAAAGKTAGSKAAADF